LLELADALREKLKSTVGVLAGIIDKKIALVAVVTDDLIKEKGLKAGDIVQEVAKLTGGTGGGKPHLAQAGGKDISKLDEALKDLPKIVKRMLK
jgi:alanyl-tRNA synthetase